MSKAFPVTGLKELDGYLAALPKHLQKGAYRAALTAAAAPIRDEARLQARKKSGKMAKAIKTGSPRQREDGNFSVFVRLDGEHSFLGYFMEWGVEPHLITRQNTKLLAKVKVARANGGRADVLDDIEKRASKSVMTIGEDFISGTIHHPGVAAHPFMRPALDLMADEAVAAFAARIRSYIEGKTGFAAPVPDAA